MPSEPIYIQPDGYHCEVAATRQGWAMIVTGLPAVDDHFVSNMDEPCREWDAYKALPKKGINFQGEWREGQVDKNGRPAPVSHPNARFTLRVDALDNYSPKMEDPAGVITKVFTFNGRDSDTMPPVRVAKGSPITSVNNPNSLVVTVCSSSQTRVPVSLLASSPILTSNPVLVIISPEASRATAW